MIALYYWPTPNGHKITMFLEEAGLEYAIHPVDISAGDQFRPDFLAISPNNRMPAIIDTTPAEGDARAQDCDGVAVLADRWPGTDGRTEPPFRGVRADQDPVRDRPLRQGDEPSLRGPRSPPRQPPIHRRRHLQHRRHGILSMGRSVEAPAAESGRRPEPAALVRCGARARRYATGLRERRTILEPPCGYGRGKEDPFRANSKQGVGGPTEG